MFKKLQLPTLGMSSGVSPISKTVQQSPDFFIEYLTKNVIFHLKSHVTKHEFWGLLILKSQHPVLPNLTWNETWNDTSLKKSGEYIVCILLPKLFWPSVRKIVLAIAKTF